VTLVIIYEVVHTVHTH